MRALLLRASRSRFLAERATRYRFARAAVRRFMPGEDVEAALLAAKRFQADGMGTVLTRLGENVTDAAEADAAVAHYLEVLDRIAERGLDCELSVKPTQLGLDVDAKLAERHLDALAERAAERNGFVWVDMEGSAYTEVTLALYRAVRARHANVGICLQSYLRRTEADLEALLPLAPAIRLVKGAYAEPKRIAFAGKQEVDEAFFRAGQLMLADRARGSGVRVVFGTHDRRLIERLRLAAAEVGVPPDGFEVHMLYGIRRHDQARLARAGCRVRVLISYGPAWFPWFMRRLAERPANVLFLLRSVVVR